METKNKDGDKIVQSEVDDDYESIKLENSKQPYIYFVDDKNKIENMLKDILKNMYFDGNIEYSYTLVNNLIQWLVNNDLENRITTTIIEYIIKKYVTESEKPSKNKNSLLIISNYWNNFQNLIKKSDEIFSSINNKIKESVNGRGSMISYMTCLQSIKLYEKLKNSNKKSIVTNEKSIDVPDIIDIIRTFETLGRNITYYNNIYKNVFKSDQKTVLLNSENVINNIVKDQYEEICLFIHRQILGMVSNQYSKEYYYKMYINIRDLFDSAYYYLKKSQRDILLKYYSQYLELRLLEQRTPMLDLEDKLINLLHKYPVTSEIDKLNVMISNIRTSNNLMDKFAGFVTEIKNTKNNTNDSSDNKLSLLTIDELELFSFITKPYVLNRSYWPLNSNNCDDSERYIFSHLKDVTEYVSLFKKLYLEHNSNILKDKNIKTKSSNKKDITKKDTKKKDKKDTKKKKDDSENSYEPVKKISGSKKLKKKKVYSDTEGSETESGTDSETESGTDSETDSDNYDESDNDDKVKKTKKPMLSCIKGGSYDTDTDTDNNDESNSGVDDKKKKKKPLPKKTVIKKKGGSSEDDSAYSDSYDETGSDVVDKKNKKLPPSKKTKKKSYDSEKYLDTDSDDKKKDKKKPLSKKTTSKFSGKAKTKQSELQKVIELSKKTAKEDMMRRNKSTKTKDTKKNKLDELSDYYLRWNIEKGHSVVKITGHENEEYTFLLSTMQMLIYTLFNEEKFLTVEQIAKQTKLPLMTVTTTIEQLYVERLLVRKKDKVNYTFNANYTNTNKLISLLHKNQTNASYDSNGGDNQDNVNECFDLKFNKNDIIKTDICQFLKKEYSKNKKLGFTLNQIYTKLKSENKNELKKNIIKLYDDTIIDIFDTSKNKSAKSIKHDDKTLYIYKP